MLTQTTNQEVDKLLEQYMSLSLEEVVLFHTKFKTLLQEQGVDLSSIGNLSSGTNANDDKSLEQQTFKVKITKIPEEMKNKIPVIKFVKDFLNVELSKAKEYIDNLPFVLKEGLPETEANEIKEKLETLTQGLSVEIE